MNKSTLLLIAGLCLGASSALAQAVIFPQLQQPGVSTIVADAESWTLTNDLLSARFTSADGHLMFDGCEALGLKPGSELFFVDTKADGVIPASRMTLVSANIEPLTANPSSTRGSERFNGNALHAVFTYGDLTVEWRAVLRDGSHYLRTEMALTSSADVEMRKIIPMNYTVAEGEPYISTVGNTRGAILASSKVFAGVETPMSINSVGTEVKIPVENDEKPTHTDGFKLTSWTPDNLCWTPGREVPSQILTFGFADSEIAGAYGQAEFTVAGEQTVTFKYKSGNHRLNTVGVDVVNDEGDVVTFDYHVGYTGNNAENNVYTINIPSEGIYTIRYFVETQTETIDSSGNILFSETVNAVVDENEPEVVVTLPEDGMDRFWTIHSLRSNDSPRYVTEVDGGLTGNSVRTAASSWHFMSRTDGSWDIINAATGNYIVTGAANNTQLKTSATAPAKGWKILATDNPEARIIVNGNSQFNTTTNAHGYQVFNWGSGTTTNDAGCDYYFTEVAENPDIFATDTPITGQWNRNTTLVPGKTWKVGAVVGLVAPNQTRRSVLAYSERERVMSWHPMPIYVSWYELNIDRNNDINYTNNMNVEQCTDVVDQWRKNLYEAQGANIQAFVWDDGWDVYGLWTFNKNFPNGFKEPNESAMAMNCGIGAWLGPVGGYGQSGTYRRNYWKDKGGMVLSNPDYYKVFLDAVTTLTTDYDFRYFKLDGISAQFSSVGPDAGTVGEENAEAIIDIEQQVREIKPDIFLCTSVGTWASVFWYQYTDATWRQEQDFGKIGVGNDREQSITYRDRLVHQNYVVNSPLCPINSIMTHGFILTTHGATATNRSYKSILNELRCSFGCGNSQVELYADYALLNSINGGKLWSDIADCIRWQEAMADVLPDIHWVGGNPWTGSNAEVYGWAAWNGKHATLTLRNGNSAQPFTFTLREVLDIPEYVTTPIVLTPAFSDIEELPGLKYGQPIDLDKQITVEMPAYSVYVLNGIHEGESSIELPSADTEMKPVAEGIYDLSGRCLNSASAPGIYIINGIKTLVK